MISFYNLTKINHHEYIKYFLSYGHTNKMKKILHFNDIQNIGKIVLQTNQQ